MIGEPWLLITVEYQATRSKRPALAEIHSGHLSQGADAAPGRKRGRPIISHDFLMETSVWSYLAPSALVHSPNPINYAVTALTEEATTLIPGVYELV